jgi:hypothetical protein
MRWADCIKQPTSARAHDTPLEAEGGAAGDHLTSSNSAIDPSELED